MARKKTQPGLFDLPTGQPKSSDAGSGDPAVEAPAVEDPTVGDLAVGDAGSLAQPDPGTSSNVPTTITALTTHIVALFERDSLLKDVWVTGEVSNWKQAASGHVYFSLKDSGATISGVMWRRAANSHSWLPTNGDQIIAHGYVGVYPERGGYQLYVNKIQPAGRGQLYAQFERLKEQLGSAGLFDAERKRGIPLRPKRVGVVTSADAAALRDILRVISARWPMLDVVVFPTLVQGTEAPKQIVAALETANQYSIESEPLDVIILARGGGSIEDLWSFNDQRVAYAVAESALPVVCGVGHETDFTIADFVADLRVPTPSAAALAVTPDKTEALDWINRVRHTIGHHVLTQLRAHQQSSAQYQHRLDRLHPRRQLDLRRQQLEDRTYRLHSWAEGMLARSEEKNRAAQLRLDALNPRNVLRRGYSIVEKEGGKIVNEPSDSQPGEMLTVHSNGGAYSVERK